MKSYKNFIFLLTIIFTLNIKFLECKNNITYSYDLEVYSCLEEKSFELSNNIEIFAKKQNKLLNSSIFFYPEFLLKTKEVRKYHLKDKYYEPNKGHIFKVKTQDNINIYGTFFDRNSDTLVLVGAGFTNPREIMSPFLDIFSNYDVALFDYRGHGLEAPWSITKSLFQVNCSKTTLGYKEELDVIAVLNYLKNNKKYKKVIGLGICYSSLIFVKTESLYPNSFDKLILDSCWLSLDQFINKLKVDPKRICSPQYGGWENNWPFNKKRTQDFIERFAQSLFSTKFDKINILDYAPNISTNPEILLFYGKDDLVVTREEFETVFNNINSKNKNAIITNNPHVRNHLKQKELYKFICELFIESDNLTFLEILKNNKIY